MRAPLVEDRVTSYLLDHPGTSALDIARAIRAQDKTVRDVLLSPLFRAETVGRRVVYSLASNPSKPVSSSHKGRVLALLADGKPHSYMEGYRLGVMMHSRVADLRKDGHEITCVREGHDYIYTLVESVSEGAGPAGGVAPSLTDGTAGETEGKFLAAGPPELSVSPAISAATETPAPPAVGVAFDSKGQLVFSGSSFTRKSAA